MIQLCVAFFGVTLAGPGCDSAVVAVKNSRAASLLAAGIRIVSGAGGIPDATPHFWSQCQKFAKAPAFLRRPCHPERSEGSAFVACAKQILRCAQDDKS